MSIAVIAGLGNPGTSYEGTRHNIGFVLIDALAEECGGSWKKERQITKAETCQVQIAEQPVTLIKPMDYMNNSGKVLGTWCRYYQIPSSSVAAIYDDITLDPARGKISQGGGDGGHNGVADMLQHLGRDFVRFRIGIGAKTHPEMNLVDFVLGKIPDEHLQLLREELPRLLNGLISLVKTGPNLTMNHFNQKRSPDERS